MYFTMYQVLLFCWVQSHGGSSARDHSSSVLVTIFNANVTSWSILPRSAQLKIMSRLAKQSIQVSPFKSKSKRVKKKNVDKRYQMSLIEGWILENPGGGTFNLRNSKVGSSRNWLRKRDEFTSWRRSSWWRPSSSARSSSWSRPSSWEPRVDRATRGERQLKDGAPR